MRVVGVMPRGFAMPAPDVQLYLPWGLPEQPPRDQHYVVGLARLAPGDDPRAGRGGAARGRAPRSPASTRARTPDWSVRLISLQDELGRRRRGGRSLVLLLAVALVLLVACANVALLSLARSLERLRGGLAAPGARRLARRG